MLTAWVIGLLMGAAGSMPVAGPTTALVLSLGLDGRYRSAALVGLGSALPECVWASLALFGFATLVEGHAWIEPVAQAITVLLLIGIGTLLIVRAGRTPPAEPHAAAAQTGALRSLAVGFSLTGLNPTLIVNWAAAVALAYSLGLLEPSPTLAIPFGLGVGMGIMTWFAVVLRLLRLHRGRISPGVRTAAMRVMGALLVVIGLFAAGRALLV